MNVSRVVHPRDMLERKHLAQDEITQVFGCTQDMLGLLERDSFSMERSTQDLESVKIIVGRCVCTNCNSVRRYHNRS